MFFHDPESHRQAWELWNSMDPGGCPFPAPEDFFDDANEPRILEIFPQTTMALEDPSYFRDYCDAVQADENDGITRNVTSEDLVFEFEFPFVCGDENGEYDFGRWGDERRYVVPGSNRNMVIASIEQDISNQLASLTEGSWWNNWVSLHAHVPEQDYLSAMEEGNCTVFIRYTDVEIAITTGKIS